LFSESLTLLLSPTPLPPAFDDLSRLDEKEIRLPILRGFVADGVEGEGILALSAPASDAVTSSGVPVIRALPRPDTTVPSAEEPVMALKSRLGM
jgi:hypothetical protein